MKGERRKEKGERIVTCYAARIGGLCVVLLLSLLLAGCKSNRNTKETVNAGPALTIPAFNADSAYSYVARQVAFGPRVPGTAAHAACLDWLSAQLRLTGAEVMIQKGSATIYDGSKLPLFNVVARFQPQKNNRILLMAHWDSRPFADHDPDPARRDQPIDGANDGASGVGVLLEIARHLGKQHTPLGIDIILFDLEDYGVPDHKDLEWKEDSWCLGSRNWARNPHVAGYTARFGILLDMVGSPTARFAQEEVSRYYAQHVLDKVWNSASEVGSGRWFSYEKTAQLVDDHRYVNELAGIPSIDIIDQDPTTESSFNATWHTHNDNLNHISKETLGAVGRVVLQVIYSEK